MDEGSRRSAVWRPAGEERGWPRRTHPCNIVNRLTGGLHEAYTAVRASRAPGNDCVPQLPWPAIETSANGRLVLSATMPLIAQRYRYQHTLSASDLSQIVSAVDTYRGCAPTADGRSSPLVALKILNAQHWALGAQEYERTRQLWRKLARDGARPRIVQPRTHFEQGAHFGIVFDLLTPLAALDCGAMLGVLGHASMLAPHLARQLMVAHPAGSAGAAAAAAATAAGSSPIIRPRPLCSSSSSVGAPLPTATPLAAFGGASAAAAAAASASGAGAASVASRPPRPRLDLETLRHATAQLLGSLATLHGRRLLHADLKPENLMLEPPAASGGVHGALAHGALGGRVVLIDFSNAMALHEAPAYHDAFDVQTLAYRAPEVVYGLPFGCPIDLWSLGVTLAELYSGRGLLLAASRGGLAVELAQLLGQPPPRLFDDGRYAAELLPLVAHTSDALPSSQRRQRLSVTLGAPASADAQQLLDLIARLLVYDPAARLSARDALCHPFLAPAFPFGALMAAPAAEHEAAVHEAAEHEEEAAASAAEGAHLPKEEEEALSLSSPGSSSAAAAPAANRFAEAKSGGSGGAGGRAPKRKLPSGGANGIGGAAAAAFNPVLSPRAPSRARPEPGAMAVRKFEQSF